MEEIRTSNNNIQTSRTAGNIPLGDTKIHVKITLKFMITKIIVENLQHACFLCFITHQKTLTTKLEIMVLLNNNKLVFTNNAMFSHKCGQNV
jgi:hypothetical protein